MLRMSYIKKLLCKILFKNIDALLFSNYQNCYEISIGNDKQPAMSRDIEDFNKINNNLVGCYQNYMRLDMKRNMKTQ